MRDETIIKLTAIICITILQIVNLLTAKINGNIMITIGAIIGGLAGYEYGKRRVVKHD